MQRRCGPPPDRYRLGCAAPRGPKGVLYLCRPMASNSTLQRPTAQRRRRRRRNPQVCGGERGQPNWITGALGPGRRGVHARGSAEPALPCSSPNRLQRKVHCTPYPGADRHDRPHTTTQNAEGDLRFGHGARRLTRRPGRVAANQDHRAGALGQTQVDAAQLVWARSFWRVSGCI